MGGGGVVNPLGFDSIFNNYVLAWAACQHVFVSSQSLNFPLQITVYKINEKNSLDLDLAILSALLKGGSDSNVLWTVEKKKHNKFNSNKQADNRNIPSVHKFQHNFTLYWLISETQDWKHLNTESSLLRELFFVFNWPEWQQNPSTLSCFLVTLIMVQCRLISYLLFRHAYT